MLISKVAIIPVPLSNNPIAIWGEGRYQKPIFKSLSILGKGIVVNTENIYSFFL